MPKLNFRFMPPLSCPACLCVAPAPCRPTRASMPSTSRGTSPAATPLNCAKSSKCSWHVSSSQSTSCCGQTPKSFCTSAGALARQWPKMVQDPRVGGSNPQSMASVVVLPAPLWPSSAKISPCNMIKSKDLTAWKFPKTLQRPCNSTVCPLLDIVDAASPRSCSMSIERSGETPISAADAAPAAADEAAAVPSELPVQSERQNDGRRGKYHGLWMPTSRGATWSKYRKRISNTTASTHNIMHPSSKLQLFEDKFMFDHVIPTPWLSVSASNFAVSSKPTGGTNASKRNVRREELGVAKCTK
mmetsp:Transcript_169578/g.538388  ORF Transcript_169578/g.538388 Transcript_169578/m.538388 type:complete len:301 (-) Transcript_169578:1766-2668(-)